MIDLQKVLNLQGESVSISVELWGSEFLCVCDIPCNSIQQINSRHKCGPFSRVSKLESTTILYYITKITSEKVNSLVYLYYLYVHACIRLVFFCIKSKSYSEMRIVQW
jgi:hypothetical protein